MGRTSPRRAVPLAVMAAGVFLASSALVLCSPFDGVAGRGDGGGGVDAPAEGSEAGSSGTDSSAVEGGLCSLARCTRCGVAGTCEIDCPGPFCAGATVTCPPGVPCLVTCSGAKSCEPMKIDCERSTYCKLRCVGGVDVCELTEIRARDGVLCVECVGGAPACDNVTCRSDLACTTVCESSGCTPGATCTSCAVAAACPALF